MRPGLLTAGFAVALFGAVAWLSRGEAALRLEPLALLPIAAMLGWLSRGRQDTIAAALDLVEPFVALDARGRVVHANESAFEIFAVANQDRAALESRLRACPALRNLLTDATCECGEFFSTERTASRRCFEVRVSRSQRQPGPRVLSFFDVTARRASQQELYHLAHFDSLTGLPNRRFSHKHLEMAIAQADRTATPLALLKIDLDRFKAVNDSLGHAAGDALLRILAQRLRQDLRAADASGLQKTTLARLGGDEFVIASHCPGGGKDAAAIAERLLVVLAEPVLIEGREIRCGGSVGIAFYPRDGGNGESVMRAADVALYHAKSLGRGNYQFFDEEMTQAARRKALIESRLRDAIEAGELEVYFQPKRCLRSNDMIGAEALLRWQTPDLGSVSPSEFVPVAEEFGLIEALGDWGLDRVCAHLAEWRGQGWEPVPISVNVSPLQFGNGNLDGRIAAVLRRHGIPAEQLEIELTESAILEDEASALETLRLLRSFGVRISLDDFGSGYSSLGYLNRIPIDVLKLDRTFLRDIHLDPGAEGVVSAVVAVAHSLKLQVVAEGVDCEEQIPILRDIGCDAIQGFLSGPPVSAAEFAEQLGDPIRSSAEESEGDGPVDLDASPFAASVLVVEDGRGTLGVLAMRLNRIGVIALYANGCEEGTMLAGERQETIGAVVCGPDADPRALRALLDRIDANSERACSLVVSTDGVVPEDLLDLRDRSGVRDRSSRVWVLHDPVDDVTLRSAMQAARSEESMWSTERTDSRAPVEIVADTRFERHRASILLSSLSHHGAFLESERLPAIASTLQLAFAIEDTVIETEARVLYHVLQGEAAGASGFGIHFGDLPAEALEAIEAILEKRAVRCAG